MGGKSVVQRMKAGRFSIPSPVAGANRLIFRVRVLLPQCFIDSDRHTGREVERSHAGGINGDCDEVIAIGIVNFRRQAPGFSAEDEHGTL